MAGRFPQSFLNDLVARADIVALIGERVKLTKAGSNYKGLCPFHDEKSPSFTVSADKQFYHCFGCQESGTALKFLMEYDRLEFVPAVEALAAIVGVEVQREGSGAPTRRVGTELYEVLEQAARVFRKLLPSSEPAVTYLKGRDLTGVTARDFGLGFAPDAWDTMMTTLGSKAAAAPGSGVASENDLLRAGLLTQNDNGRRYDRFRNRIMFPIRDTRGRVIGFGGRVMGEGEPKYLNSPETDVFKKGQELYGLFEARQALRQIDEFFVVEGYMDVIALAQAGICNAVATLGTASSTLHFTKLYQFAPRVICCFDGDKAGRAAAWKALAVALPAIKDGCQLRFMFLPDGEDPDSLVRKEGRSGFLRRAAGGVSALDYLFDTLAKGLDLSTPDDQARFAYLAKPLIETVPEGVLKDLLHERLGRYAGQAAIRSLQNAPAVAAPSKPTGARGDLRGPVSAASKVSSTSDAPPKENQRTRRLLMMLLKSPQFGRDLPDAEVAAIADLPSMFVQVLQFVRAQSERAPDVEVGLADILGYWAGQPDEPLLLELAGEQPLLPPTFAAFCEDVRRLGEQKQRSESASRLAQMRDADLKGALSEDQLRAYWEQRQGKEG